MAELHLIYHNIFSSILFLLGTTTWIITFFLSGGDKLAGQIMTYAAYCLLLMHAHVEIIIDLRYTRTVIHGRYSSNTSLNIFQSTLFGTAVLCDAMSYILIGDPLGYYGYGASAFLFFFTAILTLFGRSCCVPGAGLDNIANTLYMLGTIAMLFSAYEVIFTADGNNQFLAPIAKWAGIFLWGVAAALYTGRDLLKLRQQPSKENCEPLHDDSSYDYYD